MDLQVIDTDGKSIIAKEVNETVAQANAIMITDPDKYVYAANFLKVIKNAQKKADIEFDDAIEKAHGLWKLELARKAKYVNPLKEAEAALKNKMLAYNAEQERIAKEKQEQLDREAKAEEDRKRKALEARAEKALDSGKVAKADELLAKAEEVHVSAPVVRAQVVKVAGQATVENWFAEVTDLKALVKAIAEGKAPLNFIEANMPILNKQAKAMKGTWSYPGVAFKMTKGLSARAK